MARRRLEGLERVLGANALFSTAYGNVGSSIYYALGLVASYALGLTPVVFIITGFFFFCTAASYAEATTMYPEAGGSSSFARRAFNEFWSFFAAWAQMLTYICTIAISAFFVPHYIGGLFWAALRHSPGDIIAGAAVIVVLAVINVVGVKESTGVNVLLALIDFMTQLLLVVVGFFLVFSPQVLADNVHLGVAPTWKNFVLAIPIGMLAYTGIETISNMSEEARDEATTIPAAINRVRLAVFAIYFTLPAIALSALPVHQRPDGSYYTLLGLSEEQGGYAGDPILGFVKQMNLGPLQGPGEVYVGLLAATILFLATNAGLIGVSRLVYSMGIHRQLPDQLRQLHPKYRTPWIGLLVFGAVAIVITLPGKANFLGNLYAFGAMLSFTLAHASVVWMRHTMPDEDLPWRGPTSFHVGGYDVPTFAILGGIGTFVSWLVTVLLHVSDGVAPVGLIWLLLGMVVYYTYRRSQHLPLTQTVLAPHALTGPALEVEYRSILMPISSARVDDVMTATALRLAAESNATLVVMYPIEVPLNVTMSAPLDDEVADAEYQLRQAAALAREYGVDVITRIVRTRNIGQAIVEEAERRRSEIIVLGARDRHKPGQRVFGPRVDYVLRNAHCRVMVGAEPAPS